MWPIIAGAILGLMKGNADQQRADQMRAAEAEKTRYSPWTGMQGQTIPDADRLGPIMQGAMAGAMINQGLSGKEAAPNANGLGSVNTATSGNSSQPWSLSYGLDDTNNLDNQPSAWANVARRSQTRPF